MKGTKWKRNGLAILAMMLCAVLAAGMAACGGSSSTSAASGSQSASASASAYAGGKTFVYGTTGYGVSMEDNGLDPHNGYFGWSCLRYGVGETLFKFSDAMEPEPWLATAYEFVDDTHVKITLRDDVKFSNGRAMDGQAVKECLDDLVAKHDRAPGDMKIANVTAEGNIVTIETSEPCPALINYLCDPYGCIVDEQAGITGQSIVVGTGPYIATDLNDTEITLAPNTNYWNGTPKVDKIIVRSFDDADSLQSALQTGEVNATYGLAYASYALFQNDQYNISDTFTSRVFFGQANYDSAVMQDEAVRKALAMGIDKEGFVATLLNGRGQVAKGPFPASIKFGDDTVSTESYDPEGAKAVLEAAGWVDSDGDGIREKDGRKLTVRWLTYPSRLELPLLAESAQATLKAIGIDVEVNNTKQSSEIRKDKGAWDVYVSALVTAPTGDPEYFFRATCMADSPKNFGGYSNAKLDELAGQLHKAFNPDERAALATTMSQAILDDHGYFFASFLQMGIVSQANVKGLAAHPCDYYEIIVDLDV